MAVDRLPAFTLPGNDVYPERRFVAEDRITIEGETRPPSLETDERILQFVADLWSRTYRAMEPEHDRMRRCELYYSGYHYENPEDNFNNEITNYPRSVVEGIWSEMVESVPRPEIQPGYGLKESEVDALNEYATWLMNTDGFDNVHRRGTREMLKLGWNIDMIVFDPKTGMPYPKVYNNWHFYPDLTASHEDDAMYFFLAGPVPTDYLRACFPDLRAKIVPDHWTSPSYDALVRPLREAMGVGGMRASYDDRPMIGDHVYPEGGTPIPGSTYFTRPSGSTEEHGGRTTFVWQLVMRDLSTVMSVYQGKRWVKDRRGRWAWHYDYLKVPEQACSSGWRVIQVTSNGTVLDCSPLDECYNGLNFTLGRAYDQGFRFFNAGEIDDQIPKVRAINRRLNLLNTALEYEALPIGLIDKGSGVDINKKALMPGDVLRKAQGSQVSWMEFRGVGEQQFLLLQREEQDIDVVTGWHDVSQGQRPPGIEAGVAIARLQNAGRTRIRGKERGQFARYSAMLKKLMVCAGMKLNRRIQFRGTKGQLVTIDPTVLTNEYRVAFAPGTGLLSSRNDKKSEALQMFQAGAIDIEELLDAYDWKNRGAVLQRMQAQQQMQMLMASMGGGEGGGGGRAA